VTISAESITIWVRQRRFGVPSWHLSPRAVSWLQVSPLALILVVLFALPTVPVCRRELFRLRPAPGSTPPSFSTITASF